MRRKSAKDTVPGNTTVFKGEIEEKCQKTPNWEKRDQGNSRNQEGFEEKGFNITR